MSLDSEITLREMKQELADTELSIEQCADQGDIPMVEYYDEQRNFLNKEIKRLQAELNNTADYISE